MPNEDPAKTGEPTGKTGEDLVSKVEFEKLTTELEKEKKDKGTLQKEMDNLRLEVLDPDYMAFKESKNKPESKKPAVEVDTNELENMPRAKFVDLIVDKVSTAITPKLEQELGKVKQGLQNVMADREVDKCAAKYKDFWDYKQDMLGLVKQNDALRVEDAYKLAKQNRKLEKDEEEQKVAAKAASEKPGGPSAPSMQAKDFKDKDKAAEDAWSKTMGDKQTL